MRRIDLLVPGAAREKVEEALEGQSLVDHWYEDAGEGRVRVTLLVETEQSEPILDRLEKACSGHSPFRLVLLPVEGTLPRPVASTSPKAAAALQRVSREELYSDIEKGSRLTWVFLTLVVLSAVVAAVGLVRGQVAILVGAMVIAPLLGPNVALSLATTLGDVALAFRASRTILAGTALALVFSGLVGVLFPVDPGLPELHARTVVDWGDIVLALASGVAGALAFTTGAPASLIGVMVAVALMPPLVTAGMFLGSGHPGPAAGAALLLLTNVVCINLASVVTFLAQGIRPRRWWEAERAKKATRVALALWTLLLITLSILIYVQQVGRG